MVQRRNLSNDMLHHLLHQSTISALFLMYRRVRVKEELEEKVENQLQKAKTVVKKTKPLTPIHCSIVRFKY